MKNFQKLFDQRLSTKQYNFDRNWRKTSCSPDIERLQRSFVSITKLGCELIDMAQILKESPQNTRRNYDTLYLEKYSAILIKKTCLQNFVTNLAIYAVMCVFSASNLCMSSGRGGDGGDPFDYGDGDLNGAQVVMVMIPWASLLLLSFATATCQAAYFQVQH